MCIDSLINTKGYYNSGYWNFMFYDNGLFVYGFEDRNYERYEDDATKKNILLFLKEISEDEQAKGIKLFYDFDDWGSYVICGDTIKMQIMHKSYSLNDAWHGKEKWYKIIDKSTIQLINSFYLTTDKKEIEMHNYYNPYRSIGEYATFIPIPVKPKPDNCWILKEKWFWCDELDWKDYMKKIEQKKIKKK
jgi:hypothetical protein